MTLSITPIIPVNVAQAATLDVALQPGTVVAAQVLKLLEANLVRIAIASLTLDVATSIPLQVGQTLQLAVSQNADGLKLAIVDQGSASEPDVSSAAPAVTVKQAPSIVPTTTPQVLTPAQALVVVAATQEAAARQTSLAPLFANLVASVTQGSLPPVLQEAVAQVLALRPNLDQTLTGPGIKAALQTSGLFHEASLATASPAPSRPDLKAALIVLRQTLSTWLASSPVPEANSAAPSQTANVSGANPRDPQISTQPAVTTPNDGSQPEPVVGQGRIDEAASPQTLSKPAALAATVVVDAEPEANPPALASRLPGLPARQSLVPAEPLNLLQTFVHGAGDTTKTLPTETLLGLLQLASTAEHATRNDGDQAHTNTPPPPFRGALPTAQPIAQPLLTADASPLTTARVLLDDTDAAIARQTLLQIASLPQSDRPDVPGARPDPAQPRWAFEIPFATPQGTAIAQFEIARDGGGNGEAETVKRVWRARFSLDVEPTGPVHALISFSGDITSVRMWAERPATAAQLRANAGQLGEALHRADLKAGDIVIAHGAPLPTNPAPAGHFLDRAS